MQRRLGLLDIFEGILVEDIRLLCFTVWMLRTISLERKGMLI